MMPEVNVKGSRLNRDSLQPLTEEPAGFLARGGGEDKHLSDAVAFDLRSFEFRWVSPRGSGASQSQGRGGVERSGELPGEGQDGVTPVAPLMFASSSPSSTARCTKKGAKSGCGMTAVTRSSSISMDAKTSRASALRCADVAALYAAGKSFKKLAACTSTSA